MWPFLHASQKLYVQYSDTDSSSETLEGFNKGIKSSKHSLKLLLLKTTPWIQVYNWWKNLELTLKPTQLNFTLSSDPDTNLPSKSTDEMSGTEISCNFNNSNQSNPNEWGEKDKKSRIYLSNHKKLLTFDNHNVKFINQTKSHQKLNLINSSINMDYHTISKKKQTNCDTNSVKSYKKKKEWLTTRICLFQSNENTKKRRQWIKSNLEICSYKKEISLRSLS